MPKPTVEYLGITFTRSGYLLIQAGVFTFLILLAGAVYFLPHLGRAIETPQVGKARPFGWGLLGLIAIAELGEAFVIMRKFDAVEER